MPVIEFLPESRLVHWESFPPYFSVSAHPDTHPLPPVWARRLTLLIMIYAGVALALVLMVVGHLRINGQIFDQITGEYYNVFSRWVSDYAAKAPEGWWIKGGIFSFSGALLLMMGGLSRLEAVSPRGVGRAFFLQCTTACMVGGLVLVAIFDISPSQFEVVEKTLLLEAATRERGPAPTGAVKTNEEEEASADPASETGPVLALLELLNPEGASLREELLRERKAMDEDDRAMLDYFREMNWDHTQVIDFLKARYQALEVETAKEGDAKEGEVAVAVAAAAPPVHEIRRLPKPERHVAQAYYHRMGFHLFLTGFVLCSIYMTRVEWKEKRYDRLPGTFLTLLLTLIFSGWLFFEQQRLAGIPQRALLVLIAVWLLRLGYRLPGSTQASKPLSTKTNQHP